VPPELLGLLEPPPHAAASITAADATSRAAARRGPLDLTLRTMRSFLEGVAPLKPAYLRAKSNEPRNCLRTPVRGLWPPSGEPR
jgi:hypothetical protein